METKTNGAVRIIAIALMIMLLLVGKKVLDNRHLKPSLIIPQTSSSISMMPM